MLYVRITVRLYNLFLPVYFNLTGWHPSYKLGKNRVELEDEYIVSLTTFPERIEKVWLTIESILRQSVKPSRIILWLYSGEFKDKDAIPARLRALEKRGLEIKFCSENLMPHKKYFYTIIENPEAHIITIDDDMFYPPDLIALLLKYHAKYPTAICCPITRLIKIDDDKIRPYREWSYLKSNSAPNYFNLIMSGGGTLFPARSLHPSVLDKDLLVTYALKTDDIWLKIMSLRNETKVLSLAGEFSRFYIPIITKRNIRLTDFNINKGYNDKVFNDLIRYFNIDTRCFQ